MRLRPRQLCGINAARTTLSNKAVELANVCERGDAEALSDFCSVLKRLMNLGALDAPQILTLFDGGIWMIDRREPVSVHSLYDSLPTVMQEMIDEILSSPTFEAHRFTEAEAGYERIRMMRIVPRLLTTGEAEAKCYGILVRNDGWRFKVFCKFLVATVENDSELLPNALKALRAEVRSKAPKGDDPGVSRATALLPTLSVNLFYPWAETLFQLVHGHAPLTPRQKRLVFDAVAGIASAMPVVYRNRDIAALDDYCTLLTDLASLGALDARQVLLLLGGQVSDTFEVTAVAGFESRVYKHLPKPMRKLIKDMLIEPVFDGYQFDGDERDFEKIRQRALKR